MARSRRPIWIVTARVGAGHVQAARALCEALDERGQSGRVRYIDLMSRVPDWFRAIYAGGYATLAGRFPQLYGRLYRATDAPPSGREGKGETRTTLRNARVAAEGEILGGLREDLIADRPHWIIHAHFLAPPTFAAWISESGLATSQAVVVTDFYPHRVWAVDGADRYFVPADMTRDRLVRLGIDSDRIQITGIPVTARHRAPTDRDRVRRDFRWRADGPAIVLLAGSDFVAGPIEATVDLLAEAFPGATLQATAGNAAGLLRRLERQARRHANLRVVGFTDRIHDLLGAADIVLTKTGGVTSTECLVHGTPIVALYPVPGQERCNADYLAARGAAVTVTSPREIVPIVRSLLGDRARLDSMRRAARALARPRAADTIVRSLLADDRRI